MPKLRSGYVSPEEQEQGEKKQQKQLLASIVSVCVFGLLLGIFVFSFAQPRSWDVTVFSVIVVAAIIWYLILGIFDTYQSNK